MKIFPAIDILGGKVVRLTKGDYNQVETYSNDPVDIVKGMYNSGARHLHIVDLDGAREGKPVNLDTIKKIVNESKMFVEVGGGIRTEKRIKEYLDLGVDRVILGTIAIKNFAFLKEMVKKYGEKIVVGVDAKDELVAVSGWRDVTDISSIEFCKQLQFIGVKNVIYTDIDKDGGLKGTNLEVYKKLSNIKGLDITASGGVTYMKEIQELKDIGVYGVILGKALYNGNLLLDIVVKSVNEVDKC
jgi:phosphoribosylformimino-5-aminoimidazole carboxamide ribotide isomerase